MKKKSLYILAPNDRFNYGDLLFPYIINHYIGGMYDTVRYISTSVSDLSQLGGIPTESYKELYSVKKDHDNYLIVAGGESLFATWGGIIAFVDSKYSRYQCILRKLFFFKKSIAMRIYNKYTSLSLHVKTEYPFTIGKNELPYFSGIYYNSVGGVVLDSEYGDKFLQKDNIKRILNNVDYISIRDKYTSRAIKKANIKNTIVADCAILMSDVFTEEMLTNRLSIDKNIIDTPYIFFQGNKMYLKDESEKIALELQKLQKDTNFKICLCPIGTALGHEDIEGFKYLAPILNSIGVSYDVIDNPNIYDIMWLIKSSKLYIGSSLHGIITSMSFGIPYIGYCKKKLVTYIKTWDGEENFAESTKDIYATAIKALNTPIDYNKAQTQKESVLKSLQHITHLTHQN